MSRAVYATWACALSRAVCATRAYALPCAVCTTWACALSRAVSSTRACAVPSAVCSTRASALPCAVGAAQACAVPCAVCATVACRCSTRPLKPRKQRRLIAAEWKAELPQAGLHLSYRQTGQGGNRDIVFAIVRPALDQAHRVSTPNSRRAPVCATCTPTACLLQL